MEKAYEEVRLCVKNNQHNLSTETLQMCLEALREVKAKKHNGWSNYATWLCAVYVHHTRETYEYYKSLCKELQEEQEETAVEIITSNLRMQFELEAMKYEEQANNTIWSSLINDAASQINYYEIAKALYEEM